MKSKGVLILFLLLSFFSVIITSAPAFATATEQQPAFAAEQLPAWLTEAGAVPVSDVALENVQGEEPFTTWIVCYFLLTTPHLVIWANDQVINFNYNQAVSDWRAQHGVSNLDLAKMYFQRVNNMFRYTRITWSVLYSLCR